MSPSEDETILLIRLLTNAQYGRIINLYFQLQQYILNGCNIKVYEPVHEISNNVVCATSKASDQPAHMRSLIRVIASRLSIL